MERNIYVVLVPNKLAIQKEQVEQKGYCERREAKLRTSQMLMNL
jgi:hypothetical protein